jgi:aminoglycoside/choline kinase family phosphotransferase
MKDFFENFGFDAVEILKAARGDLDKIAGVSTRAIDIIPMTGGASIRGYARIHLSADSSPHTVVLMLLSDPDPAKGVEEVMAEGAIRELPFINVQRHFKSCGVDVPEIYHYNRDQGLIYIEDCGAVHLRDAAESDDEDYKRESFEAAVREMVKIHVDCNDREDPDFLGFKVKFDRELLMWELDHFTEHAIRRRFSGKPTAGDEQKIAEHFERITAELLNMPYALQHRDYMIDNLLIQEGRTRVIDFQDAFMGPLTYDLACFLYDRDTSALLGNNLIEHLASYYADAYEERRGEKLDRKQYRRAFELCVIHRMLKVVGRFHFIDQVKRRPEFLPFIPYMLPVIADYLSRDPVWDELLKVIVKHFPELGEHVKYKK